MQCSMSIRASSLECESCGHRNKRMLCNEYTCMNCGIIDGRVMIVDETSDQRKQWEHSEADTHANKYVPSARPPRPTADKRVLGIAKKASYTFSIDTDQVPLEATSLYMATALPASRHISKARVMACTMIVAHRRTAQDIQDAALAFSLKAKTVSSEIEAVQARVRLGDKSLGDFYGYLFHSVGERRTSLLVKDALDQLMYSMQSGETRQALLKPAWGIRSLSDDMMKHIQECRMIGGDSLEILARALVVMACELHGLLVSPIPSDFISPTMMQSHRNTWRAALPLWGASHGSTAFEAHVAKKRSLLAHRDVLCPPAVLVSPVTQCKRETRELVAEQFRGRLETLSGTAAATGATHLCVVAVSCCSLLKGHVTSKGIADLLDICLTMVQRAPPPLPLVDAYGLVPLLEAISGYRRELLIARNFKTPIPTGACFIPRELMSWGTGARMPVVAARRRTSTCPRRCL